MNPSEPTAGVSRRDFIKQAAAAGTVVMAGIAPLAGGAPPAAGGVPWYRRTLRWGQTNIAEIDPGRYDIAWWRTFWKRTHIQGVLFNAGGIVAYYPSKFPLHYRAAGLGERDLYGELTEAARQDGLVVLARMDSSKAHESLYVAHPEWFGVDIQGRPYRDGEYYLTCINSPYYEEFLPAIFQEIIERSHPDGFTDNSWSGLDRNRICYCKNCAARFREKTGGEIPKARNWDDPVYRQWIVWNYGLRIARWDANNRVTQQAGGADCIWAGMNGADIKWQCANFRDSREIFSRAQICMLDNQSRSDLGGFPEGAFGNKLIHGVLGWDKVIAQSMPMYQHGRPTFRLSAKPVAEARMWMQVGIASGGLPWWHHVNAYHEDRRAYGTAEPVMAWHEANERYLVDRKPVAPVGVVYSLRNRDFFGRDNAEALVDLPWQGFMHALVRARIPYVPVHIADIEREADHLSVIILPNIGAMSDGEVQAVRRFAKRGGALIATGQTSLFDEWGEPRADFALADLFGVKGGRPLDRAPTLAAVHSYLRLTPELRSGVYGPKAGNEPPIVGARHPILAGFDQTDIFPFGETLDAVSVDGSARTLLTYIRPFPIMPPENSWMREPKTGIAGLIVNEGGAGGRVVFLRAGIDRRFALDNLPDQGDLLANIVRWAAADTIPLAVAGPGVLNCELYRQGARLILHVVNLTSAGTWRAPIHELIAVGPIDVRVRPPRDLPVTTVRKLTAVAGAGAVNAVESRDGWVSFRLESILDHEAVVLE